MRESIFLTIAKWWCNCVDLILEIVAHPWRPEELHYRRMLCAIFEMSWKLDKSEKSIIIRSKPFTGYRDLRKRLVENTSWFWHHHKTQHDMTPAWPEGVTDYLEALFTGILSAGATEKKTIQAFRLMNQVGDKHVPKNQLSEKLGVEKNDLFQKIGRLERRLRSFDNTECFAPFVSPSRAWEIEGIVQKWRQKEWQEIGEDNASRVEKMAVEQLELSVRTYNCLRNANLETVGDLLRKTEAELLRTKNFGRKSLNEIKEILRGIDPLLRIGMLAENQQTDESVE